MDLTFPGSADAAKRISGVFWSSARAILFAMSTRRELAISRTGFAHILQGAFNRRGAQHSGFDPETCGLQTKDC